MRKLFSNLKQAVVNLGILVASDWRAQAVVCLATVVGFATLSVLFMSETATDPTKFVGAVFAGWIGGYLIFLLGLVAVLLSLARPEQDFFSSRARVLLRGQEGAHIDYITGQMAVLFDLYAVSIEKEIRITRYDANTDMFRILHTSTSVLKAYLEDLEVGFEPRFTYGNASQPPPGGEESRLSFITIDGEEKQGSIGFEEGFDHGPFRTSCPPNGQVQTKHAFHCWVKAKTEPNRHSAKRYVRRLQVSLINDLPDHTVNVLVEVPRQPNRTVRVPVGNTVVVVNLDNITPGEHVYDLRLEIA